MCDRPLSPADRVDLANLKDMRAQLRAARHERDELRRQLESLQRIHDVGLAFHDVTVKERDYERLRSDRFEAALQEIAMLDDTGHGRSRRRKLAQTALRGESA